VTSVLYYWSCHDVIHVLLDDHISEVAGNWELNIGGSIGEQQVVEIKLLQ